MTVHAQIAFLPPDTLSTSPPATRGITAFRMFTPLLALLVLCSCVACSPDFDADLGHLSDVFMEDGKTQL